MPTKNNSEKAPLSNSLLLLLELNHWLASFKNETRIDGESNGTNGGGAPHLHFYSTFSGKKRVFYLAGDTKRSAVEELMNIIKTNKLLNFEQAVRYTLNSNDNPCLRLATTQDFKNKADGWNCREINPKTS